MRMNKFISTFLLGAALVFFIPKNLYAAGSLLEFNPSRISLSKGDSYIVEIMADPAGSSLVGVDVIINYDPVLIKIVKVDSTGAFTSKSAEIVDSDRGILKVAFSNSYGVFTKEKRAIAKLTIEAKKESGTTSLQFDFAPGDTKDTNMVISGGKDVLESVESLIVGLSSKTSTASLSVESGEVEGVQETTTIDYPISFADDDDEDDQEDESSDKGKDEEDVLGLSADGEDQSILDDIGRKILPSQLIGTRSLLKIIIIILTSIILLTIVGLIGYRLGKKENSS
jgi:hypothetical protein